MNSYVFFACAFVTMGLVSCVDGGRSAMRPEEPGIHAADPSLIELARVEPAPGRRALLAVFPRTACSGSTRTVLVDEKGTFFGALAPGEAALLDVPVAATTLFSISTVEVVAPVGSYPSIARVRLPPPPAGLLFESPRINAHGCGGRMSGGFYARVRPAKKEDLEALLGDAEIRWMKPDAIEGQRWIDRNRRRVEELIARVDEP